MSKWEMVRLGDVCEFINGDRGVNYPSSNDFCESGVPFINAGHLKNDTISFENMNYISEQKYNELGSGKIKNGDLLYCLRGSLGKQAIVKGVDKGAIASSLVIIRPQNVKTSYLRYCMKTNMVFEQQMKANNGSSQPNLSASSVKNYVIPLPPRSIQQKIADVLDRTSALIEKRKSQIEKLNLLIKSQFIEMFGDPVIDSKAWGAKPLNDYLVGIRYGTSTPPPYSESGFAFIRATNIKQGRVIDNGMKYISEENGEKIEKCRLNGGELIIVRSGVNTGDTCVVPMKYAGHFAGYDIIVETAPSKLDAVFLNELLNTSYMQLVVKPLTARSAQPHINAEQVRSLPIIQAPLPLQTRFADFVRQVDKSKFALQRALDELDLLYKSLMQKCFNTETTQTACENEIDKRLKMVQSITEIIPSDIDVDAIRAERIAKRGLLE